MDTDNSIINDISYSKFNPKTRHCINTALEKYYKHKIPSLIYHKFIRNNTVQELSFFIYNYSKETTLFIPIRLFCIILYDIQYDIAIKKTSFLQILQKGYFCIYDGHIECFNNEDVLIYKPTDIIKIYNHIFNYDDKYETKGVIVLLQTNKHFELFRKILLKIKNKIHMNSIIKNIDFLLDVISQWINIIERNR